MSTGRWVVGVGLVLSFAVAWANAQATQPASRPPGMQVHIFRLRNMPALEMEKVMNLVIHGTDDARRGVPRVGVPDDQLAPLRGKVTLLADARTNSMLVTTPAEHWPVVKTLLEGMDQVNLPPQVLIKATVARVTRAAAAADPFSGLLGELAAAPASVPQRVDANRLAEALAIMEERKSIEVLSRPHVLVNIGRMATITTTSTEVRIQPPHDPAAAGGVIPRDQILFMVDLIPELDDAGVLLDIAAEFPAKTGEGEPRSEKARLTVRDNQTILVRGPSSAGKDLFVFITARLVEPPRP